MSSFIVMKKYWSLFVVIVYGKLKGAFPSSMFNVGICKKTPNIIVMLKSFQRNQFLAFLLHVMLVVGVEVKLDQLRFTRFGFVTMTIIVPSKTQIRSMWWVGQLYLQFGLCNKGLTSFKTR